MWREPWSGGGQWLGSKTSALVSRELLRRGARSPVPFLTAAEMHLQHTENPLDLRIDADSGELRLDEQVWRIPGDRLTFEKGNEP